MRIARIYFIFLLALLGFPAYAQVMTTAEDGDAIDATSGSLDDSAGSIEAGRETRGRNFKGDLRVGYSRTDTDNRDATDQTSSESHGRFRAGGTFSITEKLVFGGRLASTCSTSECNPDIVFNSTLPNSSSIDDGDITFDQLYIHSFRQEKFDVAIGRLQTKFVSRAGAVCKTVRNRLSKKSHRQARGSALWLASIVSCRSASNCKRRRLV